MRASEEKQYKRQNEFNKMNYDRIVLVLPKGSKEKIKATAAEKHLSVNAFIAELIRRELNL